MTTSALPWAAVPAGAAPSNLGQSAQSALSAHPAHAPKPATQLYAKPSADFADKLAETLALLKQAAAEFTATDGTVRVTQASSLGAEDVVITHLINALGLKLPIFVLDTGALHPETLSLLELTVKSSQAPVAVFKPNNESVVTFVTCEGSEAMYKSIALRKACCAIRKLEPLERALAGKDAWITGLRREQSGNRAEVPLRDTSELEAGQANARIKLNPLARWTWGDVWHYIAIHHVDHNPLHDQFYPSIGCAPCTRAISLGEDFRSGRWWWEATLEGGSAKECGLHATHAGEAAAPAKSATDNTPPPANDAPAGLTAAAATAAATAVTGAPT